MDDLPTLDELLQEALCVVVVMPDGSFELHTNPGITPAGRRACAKAFTTLSAQVIRLGLDEQYTRGIG